MRLPQKWLVRLVMATALSTPRCGGVVDGEPLPRSVGVDDVDEHDDDEERHEQQEEHEQPDEVADCVDSECVAQDPVAATWTFALGYAHSCAVAATGAVACWGNNAYGQLGDGATASHSRPVRVTGVDAIAVSGGGFHTCALERTGTVACWGRGSDGAIGDGSTAMRTRPVRVAGISHIVEIAAGYRSTCALAADGRVWCWGANAKGQLGDGTTTLRSEPVSVVGLRDATAIVSGAAHACALRRDGAVTCWGANQGGSLGIGTTGDSARPVTVTLAKAVNVLASADYATCVIHDDATVSCWGHMEWREAVVRDYTRPYAVPGLGGVLALEGGHHFAFALDDAGTMTGWGANQYGQLAGASTLDANVPPTQLALPRRAVAVAAGGRHACATDATGDVWCWGENADGELGDGTTVSRAVPRRFDLTTLPSQ